MNTNKLILVRLIDEDKYIYLTNFNLQILSLMQFRPVSISDILNSLLIESYGQFTPTPAELGHCLIYLKNNNLVELTYSDNLNDNHPLFCSTKMGSYLFYNLKQFYSIQHNYRSDINIINILLFTLFLLDFLGKITPI